MSDKKISELSSAAALTGSEPIPTVQGGVTVRTTAQDIANLAGGGGTSFIPNGFKFITESRDLQADDAGYALLLDGENPVSLTIPYPSPLQVGESFIVCCIEESTDKAFVFYNDEVLLAPSETVLFTTIVSLDDENDTESFCVSTFPVYGEGGHPNKTALRYLMDKVGNTGTATLVAGTVTVADARVKTGAKIIVSVNTPGGTQGFLSAPAASIVDETSFVINSSSATETSTVNYWFVNP